jgi:hypothetical protein
MTKTQRILLLAQEVADSLPDMFLKRGPGKGNNFTNQYMASLNQKVRAVIGNDYVEQCISGTTRQCVDFFVPDEKTIVEVELSLYNTHNNLDRDIFKALLAIDSGYQIDTLLLVGKEPAKQRHTQPASIALIKWVKTHHALNVVIEDIKKNGN